MGKRLFVTILTATTIIIFCGNLLAQIPSPNGLAGEYYDGYFNDDFNFFQQNQPLYRRTDLTINFDNSSWNLQGQPGLADLETFSVRWRGRIYIPAAGAYTFYLSSDDASYLFLNEAAANPSPSNAAVNNGGTHVPREVSSTVLLAAGFHDMLVVYGEQSVENVIRLSWANAEAGIVKQIIPTSFLYLPEVVSGLAAYYPFDGNANDVSGNGNHGEVIGATLTIDRFGNPNSAYDFDGVNDYIRIASTPELQGGSHPISVAVWFKADLTSGQHPLVIKHLDGSRKDWGILIFNNVLQFYSERAGEDFRCIQNQGTVRPAQWHFAVFTAAEPNSKLYIDGVEVGSCSNFINHWTPTTADVEIGRVGYTGTYFTGSIDDIRIYDRALSQDEIDEFYHEGNWVNGSDDVPFKNGSFESASVNPGSFITLSNGNTAIEGWTVTGGTIDYVGAYWIASESSRSLDLNGTTPGSISQSFRTRKGSVYHLQFDMAGNPECSPSLKRLRASAAGVSQEFDFSTTGKSRQNMGWQKKAFEFIALDTLTTLTFTSLVSGSCGPAIDNVRISKPEEDIVPPAIPKELRATVGQNEVALTWNPNTEPDLLRYRIYRSTNYPTFTLHNSVAAGTTTFVDAGLDPNVIYFYRITAQDSVLNESGFSNEVSSFVPKLADLEVAGVQVPPSAFSGREIKINWTIANAGNDGTKSPGWHDEVLLSPSLAFDPRTAIRLGLFENFSALNAGEAYTITASFTLPRGIGGTRYIFVRTDVSNREPEANESNNQNVSGAIQVELSPYPDLQVTAITMPGNAFSGDIIQVGWTVQNNGAARTDGDNWYDTVFLSEDDTLDFDFIGSNKIRINETVLAVVRRDGVLDATASYTSTTALRLPHTIFGRRRIFVFTDIPGGGVQSEDGHIYEYNQFLNNDRSDTINIKLRPTPDLVVTSVGATTSIASLGEDIAVQWTVKNQGAGEPFENGWQDIIYLSRTATFEASTAFVLGTSGRIGGLKRDSSYTQSRTIRAPSGFSGENYIFVKTDFDNGVFEYQDDGNNVSLPTPIIINNPDFEIRSVAVPNSANSGASFEVVWSAINNGPGAVFNMAWNDRVYISRQPVFNPDSATVIGAFPHSGALHKDSSYTVMRTFTLPNGISGDYYIFVEADAGGRVFENQNESNNRRASTAMRVQLSPWADLQVSEIIVPDSLDAGGRVAITWTVANRGVAAATGTWTDRVYLSPGAGWNPNSAILLASAERTRGLDPNATYTQSRSITLSTSLAGSYVVTVQTDASNGVYEHTDEGNNLTNSQTIGIAAYPPSDLVVSGFTPPDSALSGSSIAVQWSVQNIGPAATLASGWSDQVYLSTDTQLDRNRDLLMATVAHSGALRSNESYTRQTNITMANGFLGDYYLIVVSDAGSVVNDADRSNNVIVSANRIHIELAPSPDLTITELHLPSQVNAGQPLTLTFTIANQGRGGISNRSWYDAVYLSQNATLDNADQTLVARQHSFALPPNSSYTDSVEVEMPGYASGTYFLIMKADSRNEIYEFNAELNNVRVGETTSTGDTSGVKPVEINQPAPADLIVSGITIPPNAMPGEEVTISWTLTNIGENPARGWLRDAVYVSTDTIFQVEDPVFGALNHYIDLSPGSSQKLSMKVNLAKLFRADAEGNLTEELPGLTPGQYHALVRTDIRRNIRESNTANNALASANFMDTDVPELRLGVPEVGMLASGKVRYYKVHIPDSLASKTLVVNLYSDLSTTNNEMYIRFGDPPTLANFDYIFTEPFSATHKITIPKTLVGNYFVLIRNNQAAISEQQHITVEAFTQPFSIFNVSPSVGGNAGQVTLKIEGASFDEITRIMLMPTGDTTNVLEPIWSDVSNPSLIFATFDLVGMTPGFYGIYAIAEHPFLDFNPVDSTVFETTRMIGEAILPAAFEVIAGGGADLKARLNVPTRVRFGQIFNFNLEITNAGINDLPAPVFKISSPIATPIALSGKVSEFDTTGIQILVLGTEGRRDVIPPGQSIYIPLYGRAVRENLLIYLHDLNSAEGGPDWGEFEAIYRDHTSEQEWASTWVAFISKIGSTWKEFYDAIRLTAVNRSLVSNDNFFQISDLIYDLLAQKNIDSSRAIQTILKQSITSKQRSKILTTLDNSDYCDACQSSELDLFRYKVKYVIPLIAAGAIKGYPASALSNWLVGGGRTLSQDDLPGIVEDLKSSKLVKNWVRSIHTQALREVLRRQADIDIAFGSTKKISIANLVEPSLLETTFDFGLFDSGLKITLGHVPGENNPKPKASGEVILTKIGGADGCSRNITIRFDLNINIEDTYNFCPGNIPTILGRDIERAIKQLEACGHAKKYLNKINFNWTFPEGSLPFFNANGSTNDCAINPPAPAPPPDEYPIISLRSIDPNDIIGPADFGDEHWITATQTLPYTIRFENDSTRATAAAQVVTITQKLDSTLDARSFRLGSFGFANHTFAVPENRAFYSARLDVRDSLGVFVDVTAGIDITTNEAFWIFRAIDPATGQLPVFNGFLPVNDAQHRGEGFANYTIRPKREAKTGDVVHAKARIIFDTNEPIDTPEIFNTIDAVLPRTRVEALPPALNRTTFTLRWAGRDDAAGSQVRQYAVYVAENEQAFELFQDGLADTSLVFSGDFGNTYRFFVLATDNAGNIELIKTAAEATVTLDPNATSVADNAAELPKTFALHQNYPNPFNPTTIIKYDLPVPSEVKLEIFDILGRRVRVLVDTKQNAGFYSAMWDGKTAAGRFVATGVYFYRIEAKEFVKTMKMLIVR